MMKMMKNFCIVCDNETENERICSVQCAKEYQKSEKINEDSRKNLICLLTEADWNKFYEKEENAKKKKILKEIKKVTYTSDAYIGVLVKKWGFWKYDNNNSRICNHCKMIISYDRPAVTHFLINHKDEIRKRIRNEIYLEKTCLDKRKEILFQKLLGKLDQNFENIVRLELIEKYFEKIIDNEKGNDP